MNPAGFADALAGRVFPSDKDRAVELARAVLARSDMMLTATEAALVARELLRALGLRS